MGPVVGNELSSSYAKNPEKSAKSTEEASDTAIVIPETPKELLGVLPNQSALDNKRHLTEIEKHPIDLLGNVQAEGESIKLKSQVTVSKTSYTPNNNEISESTTSNTDNGIKDSKEGLKSNLEILITDNNEELGFKPQDLKFLEELKSIQPNGNMKDEEFQFKIAQTLSQLVGGYFQEKSKHKELIMEFQKKHNLLVNELEELRINHENLKLKHEELGLRYNFFVDQFRDLMLKHGITSEVLDITLGENHKYI
jgi:hypothetical protein